MIDDIACRWAAALDRGLDAAEEANLSAWLEEDRRHRGALLRATAALSLLDRWRALSGVIDGVPVRQDRRRCWPASLPRRPGDWRWRPAFRSLPSSSR